MLTYQGKAFLNQKSLLSYPFYFIIFNCEPASSSRREQRKSV